MNVKLLPSALRDLRKGKKFYDSRQQNTGDYFQDCLLRDIEKLKRIGGIHVKVFGHHRLVSKRFPFAIYYRIDDPIVVVVRILDGRQDPRRLRKMLE
jgi:plasmid stabilization system protein ParE